MVGLAPDDDEEADDLIQSNRSTFSDDDAGGIGGTGSGLGGGGGGAGSGSGSGLGGHCVGAAAPPRLAAA